MDYEPASVARRGPYRTPAEPTRDDPPAPAPIDPDPVPLTALVGMVIASAARLVPTLRGREAFGREPALALAVVVLCASLAIRAAVSRARAAALRADERAIAATRRRLRSLVASSVDSSSSRRGASSPTTRGQ